MKRILLPLFALALPALAQDPATNTPAADSVAAAPTADPATNAPAARSVADWPGLADTEALAAWCAAAHAATDAPTSARFAEERLAPLLRAELGSLDPDGSAARALRAAEPKAPAALLEAAERAAAALDAPPAAPLLAARVRDGREKTPGSREALRRAAAAWAARPAVRGADPDAALAALRALAPDAESDPAALAAALDEAGADPWLGFVLRGRAEIAAAWKARGDGWASTVTEEGWKGFRDHLDLSRAELEEAWALHPGSFEPAYRMLSVCGGGCGGRGALDHWFGRAIGARLDSIDAWQQYLWFNYPRWGGSQKRMGRIARACRDANRPDTLLPVVAVRSWGQLSDDTLRDVPAKRDYWTKRRATAEWMGGEALAGIGGPLVPEGVRVNAAWVAAQALAFAGEPDRGVAARAAGYPGNWQERLLSEAVVPFAAGPDYDAPWGDRGWNAVQTLAWRLANATLLEVPNHQEWGSYYDLTLRDGADDPLLRWGSVVGQWKWKWTDKAREQLADLEDRVSGPDATRFQKMLAAQARNLLDPSDEHAAAFRIAADAWRETLDPALPAAAVDKTLAMLGYARDAAAKSAKKGNER